MSFINYNEEIKNLILKNDFCIIRDVSVSTRSW